MLRPLVSTCAQYADSRYRFLVCPYRFVNQIEVGQSSFRGCIGYFYMLLLIHRIWGSYTELPLTNEVRLQMSDGDLCPGDISRETEVTDCVILNCSW